MARGTEWTRHPEEQIPLPKGTTGVLELHQTLELPSPPKSTEQEMSNNIAFLAPSTSFQLPTGRFLSPRVHPASHALPVRGGRLLPAALACIAEVFLQPDSADHLISDITKFRTRRDEANPAALASARRKSQLSNGRGGREEIFIHTHHPPPSCCAQASGKHASRLFTHASPPPSLPSPCICHAGAIGGLPHTHSESTDCEHRHQQACVLTATPLTHARQRLSLSGWEG